MQSIDCQIDLAAELLTRTTDKLISYKQSGFEESIVIAKILAEEISVTPEFPTSRVRRKKRMDIYDEDCIVEHTSLLGSAERFKNDFFLVVVDTALKKLTERFKLMNKYCTTFSILCNIKAFASMEMTDIKRYCHNLEIFLTSCDQTDLGAIQLEFELKNLSFILPENNVAKKILEFIYENKIEKLYPNTCIALRIFLTAPVTVATAERSF